MTRVEARAGSVRLRPCLGEIQQRERDTMRFIVEKTPGATGTGVWPNVAE